MDKCGSDGLKLAQFIDRTVKMLHASRFVGTCVDTPYKDRFQKLNNGKGKPGEEV